MEKMNRNDVCWCGSGKKYKKCHLESDMSTGKPGKKASPAPGVILKTSEQIEGIRKSCRVTRDILNFLEGKIVPGITTEEINTWVHEMTVRNNAVPAPLHYLGYPKSVCTSINNVVCHGIPDDTVLKNGDIINIDVTTILNGYYGDASRMFPVGSVSSAASSLIAVARECLDRAVEAIRPWLDISIIGDVIDAHAQRHGFSVVRDYGGHGIGIKFHEEPHVHHYKTGTRGIPLVPGMTFTIEPMINTGSHKIRLLKDNWTVITADGGLSAQWEHTVLVTDSGCEILTV